MTEAYSIVSMQPWHIQFDILSFFSSVQTWSRLRKEQGKVKDGQNLQKQHLQVRSLSPKDKGLLLSIQHSAVLTTGIPDVSECVSSTESQ